MNEFSFSNSIKQLVLHLDSLISNAEEFSNVTTEEFSTESTGFREIYNIVSCQIVNFNSETGDKYQVYNYCNEVETYETKLANYFADNINHKSILSIYKKGNDDGIWYKEKEKENTTDKKKERKPIPLIYNKPPETTAQYEIYKEADDCRVQWDNWVSLMFEIYPNDAISVFSKNIRILIDGNDKYVYSGIYLTFSKRLNYKQIGIIGRICETLLNDIAFKELIPNLYQSIENQALRAAISQVMARNTSHNIGAHVMNKLIGDDLGDIKIEEFKNYEQGTPLSAEDAKILKQIAIFNNYVKCRMDYLADISFGTPLMQTNKLVYAELFKDFDKVRLLLEYISGLSDFKYKIEFKKNGEPLNDTNDLLVAIPNDILGTQAFYNILENIIRNTAKHSQKNPANPITTFTVNFIDQAFEDATDEQKNILNEFIAVEVYDSIPIKGNAVNLTNDDKTNYTQDTKKKNKSISKIDWLVYTQNKKLNEDILQDNNKKLRSSSLGLVEMDASAAYLRKRDVSFINHPSYEINYDDSWSRVKENNGTNCRHFLKAFNKIENSNNHLGYRFFLLRPAVVLVIVSDDKTVENNDELKKQGVWVKTKKEFEDDLKKGKTYSHEFVLLSGSDFKKLEKDTIETHKTSLPIRILGNIDIDEILKKKTLKEFESLCWEKWENEKYKNFQIDIVNSFDNSQNEIFQAVFLDHLYSHEGVIERENQVKKAWAKHKEANYIEALSSLAQSKMPDFYKITNDGDCKQYSISTEKFKCYLGTLNEVAKQKIKEAVLTKIIVIDERIQEATENRNFMGVPYKELYAKMNVIVPNKVTINLSENSFSEDFVENTITPFISKQIKDAKSNDFIIIHYSILERMFKKDKINEYIEEELANINVVITSGRGIPDNLTGKARFVNLSPVITAFVDVKSKYAINYLLNSSRKSNKI